jgi:glycosyltransferase involved in cell wall biosynthesis
MVHSSNLRPVKRIDLLLEAVARVQPKGIAKLLILAGESFAPFLPDLQRLGLEDRVIVREKALEIEEYLQAADLALYTSESESFCLSILEAMCFGCPSVTTRVGGIPELVDDSSTGVLVPFGDVPAFTQAIEHLIRNPAERIAMGSKARLSAHQRFSAGVIVSQYEALYRRVCG